MKILALEHEISGYATADFAPHLKAEAQRVWELYQAGIIREIYFRQDRSEAILILECQTVEAARQCLDSLPIVQAGLVVFEIIPLGPYPGFARLFS